MSDEQETYSFTAGFQKEIVAMMLFDKGSFLSNMVVVKPEFFDSPILRDIITLIIDFFKKYSRVPTETEFLEEMNAFLNTEKRLLAPVDEYWDVVIEILEMGKDIDFQPPKDKVVDFARFQAAKKVMLEGGEKDLERRDYGKIVTGIQKAMTLGKSVEDLGTFLHKDLERRLELRRTTFNRGLRGIPTGFLRVDYWLGSVDDGVGGAKGGGLCPQEVGVIMSPTKRGKTTVAANFTKEAINQGHTAVHYSFESNIRATEEIYDALITGIEKRDLDKRKEEVKERFAIFFDRPGIGELIIKHFPAGGSPWMIENHLYQLKAEGINPSLLIVDYLGLMKPADKTTKYEASAGGRYILFGQIVIELISLAQRGEYAIWLLHQSKGYAKKRYEKEGVISTEDAADSQEVMRHVDLILTINQTKEEINMSPQRMRIFAAGGRNVPDCWDVLFEYDKGKALIWEAKKEA